MYNQCANLSTENDRFTRMFDFVERRNRVGRLQGTLQVLSARASFAPSSEGLVTTNVVKDRYGAAVER